MKRIKVLHFIHSLISGGAEKQLRLLCEHMDKDRFEVAIFCVKSDGHDLTDPGIQIYANFFENLLSWPFIKSIDACLKDFDPDVVHVWLPQSVSIPAMILSRLHGKPVIFSYRNRMTFQRPLVYAEFVTALFFSNRIISNRSVEDSLGIFRWLYRLKHGIVIENAVHIPEKYLAKVERFKSEAHRFICIGRLTAQKNFARVIKAFSALKQRSDWQLDIYGDGEDKEIITRLISDLGLADRISIKGFSHNIYEEMANADALIFPSLYEGMPNVLVEALQIGLPVIASDIAANRAVIGDAPAAIWCNPQDEHSITQAINKLLEESENIETMADCGKEIASRYSLAQMVRRYQDYYKKLYDEKN